MTAEDLKASIRDVRTKLPLDALHWVIENWEHPIKGVRSNLHNTDNYRVNNGYKPILLRVISKTEANV